MHSLSIAFDDPVDETEVWHAFNQLLGFLRHNGQLIGREVQPYVLDRRMSATVFTCTPYALDERFHNAYVRSGIESLETLCGARLQMKYVGASEGESYCECAIRPYFLMTGFHSFSPILCGGCGHEVPLFVLPKLHDLGYWTLIGWDNNYRACRILDVNCTVGERWAIRQQCDHDSALSRQGRAVAAQLAELTSTPVYYYLPSFIRRRGRSGARRPCPSCGGAWRLPEAIHSYVFNKCDACLLMASEFGR
jgi:predicted  nucleic acid-binding Zn ribbon protein